MLWSDTENIKLFVLLKPEKEFVQNLFGKAKSPDKSCILLFLIGGI